MANKKTSKKSRGKFDLLLKIAIVLFGVLAFCMAFVTCVKFVDSNGELFRFFTGWQEMFGYKEVENIGVVITTEYLVFSFMAFVTFLLPLVGAILSLINNKIIKIVGACLLVLGAVLMFCLPHLAVFATGETLSTTAAAVAILENCTANIGIGAIMGGIFSLLGGAVTGYSILKK